MTDNRQAKTDHRLQTTDHRLPTTDHRKMIPYGKQTIEEDDIQAVVDVLRSDWLTTGPKVDEFEKAFAEFCGVKHAVAVSNGTAALHCAMYAADVQEGDKVLVTPMSFAASANCIVYRGGIPVFVDVRDEDLLIDPDKVESALQENTDLKGIVAVDYAGLPCDYDRLRALASAHGVFLVADACHAVGGAYKGRPVGALADMSTFSFHPVKNMTTGEGGMITTDSDEYAARLRLFRSHGVTVDFKERMESGSWLYDMVDLGWNYRITDFQCALGITQLKKLPGWIERRNEIAAMYDEALSNIEGIQLVPLKTLKTDHRSPTTDHRLPPTVHAHHLYPIRVPADSRSEKFAKLRERKVGVNVHYIPIHLHPYYQKNFRTNKGLCPVAEKAYEELISLPMYPGLSDHDVEKVIMAVSDVVGSCS